jgi:SAM-dependent methyltransferase
MPDRRGFQAGIFTVVECDQCGLGFVNPRPRFQDMGKYYPKEYYEEGFAQNRAYHLGRYAREARYLRQIERKPGPKSLLDVGCANGDFPRFMMARGWHAEGVEVSASSQPITDFKVYPQQLPDIPVHQPSYDAVTAWAVLEHVHDPMAYFRKASEVTKAGGLFVFRCRILTVLPHGACFSRTSRDISISFRKRRYEGIWKKRDSCWKKPTLDGISLCSHLATGCTTRLR